MILGAQELGKVALEIFQQNGRTVYGFLDEDETLWGTTIHHVPVLGSTSSARYLALIGEKCDVFVATTQRVQQQRLAQMLQVEKKVVPINGIHASAIIATSASLKHGNLVNMHVNIGADAIIGHHCILHTKVIVEHNGVIKDFVQVGAGSIIGAGVTLGEQVFVGAGATIVAGVTVGPGARIGAGSVVLADVKSATTVFGNPAKPIDTARKMPAI